MPPMTADNATPVTDGNGHGLIQAVAERQDRAAFAALFEYFAPRIKTFMQRSGASEASAEELAQETMLAVWRKAALFDPASAGAPAWIFTIARNLRIDALSARKPRQRDRGIRHRPGVPGRRRSATRCAARRPRSRKQRVRAALAQLSADQMRVVELSFFEEKAHARNRADAGNSAGHGQVDDCVWR